MKNVLKKASIIGMVVCGIGTIVSAGRACYHYGKRDAYQEIQGIIIASIVEHSKDEESA